MTFKNVTWVALIAPVFNLKIKDRDNIFIAEGNYLQANFSAFDPSNEFLDIKWTLTPAISPDYLEYQTSNSILYIKTGGFQPRTTYTLSVVANNTLGANLSLNRTLTFTTGVGVL